MSFLDFRRILGVTVVATKAQDAIEFLDDRISSRTPTAIAFANANLLNLAVERPILAGALENFVVLNDGVGVEIAGRLVHGKGFPENVNGTDFVPRYLETTRHDLRVYMLGADARTVEKAADALSARYPRHRIVGYRNGYFPVHESAAVASAIKDSGADVVLVAMGNPRQELWLHQHLAATGCLLGIGVGALFDFVAGNARRAPLYVRKLRLEWVYRLIQEPRRLAGRYLVGNSIFLYRIVRIGAGDREQVSSALVKH